MLSIGLTGGIGSGKSTVAQQLSALGARIIDADRIARNVVAPGTEGLHMLVAQFGSEILASDGSLNRPVLAQRVFQDEKQRQILNSIVHPLVAQRSAELIAAAGPDAIVVNDVPLLVENHMGPEFMLVVAVIAGEQLRVSRLIDQRGMSRSDIQARIAVQASDDQRKAVADVLLDNSASVDALSESVQTLWKKRLLPFAMNLRLKQAPQAKLELVPADPDWPIQAQRVIARIQSLAGNFVTRCQHIGPTSIPGMPSVDEIAIHVYVARERDIDHVVEILGAHGYIAQENYAAKNYVKQGNAMLASADPGRPTNITVTT